MIMAKALHFWNSTQRPRPYEVFLLCLVGIWTAPSLHELQEFFTFYFLALSLALVIGFASFQAQFSAKDSKVPFCSPLQLVPFSLCSFSLYYFASQVLAALTSWTLICIFSTARLWGSVWVPIPALWLWPVSWNNHKGISHCFSFLWDHDCLQCLRIVVLYILLLF